MGVQTSETPDLELPELRRSWGEQLEKFDIDGLAKSLSDVEHKLRGVRYHRDNFERVANATVERFRSPHSPPVGVAVEERQPELLFEIEGFLYQVKSALDMLARALAAAGLRSIGHTFGDRGDAVLKQLGSLPQACSAEAQELRELIERAQPLWLDQAVAFRDRIAHEGMLDEFRCLVQDPLVGPGDVSVHHPTMPGGERACRRGSRADRWADRASRSIWA